ncbi:hypothetical protein PO124_15655 [Bacillus licheniformis]|nr:hypothetical protein [Bacillus licheniformis]
MDRINDELIVQLSFKDLISGLDDGISKAFIKTFVSMLASAAAFSPLPAP